MDAHLGGLPNTQEAHHSQVDKIEPLLPLMTEGKNELEIDAPSGSLKSQREEQTVIDRKRYGMVYDYNFYLLMESFLVPGSFANVLMDEEGHLKLANFGLAVDDMWVRQKIQEDGETGAPSHLAPEVCLISSL